MLCNQCPRRCGAVRDGAPGGVCGMPERPVIARAALHFWEEPVISGTRGTGAVFFSGCNLRCVFCQNSAISQEGFGKAATVSRLQEIFWELIRQGVHNIDLVTPTHFVHAVRKALAEPLPVPVVWNSGGYEREETIDSLSGKIQIYLPDLKYMDPARAKRYAGAPDYPEIAKKAIRRMFDQTGPCVFDQDGMLRQGVLVRHLILPGGVQEAKAVMDWVADTFPRGSVWFSLMSQYIPMGRAAEFPELNRRLRRSEARAAREYLAALGLPGFVQDLEAASGDYVPQFDLMGV